MLIASLLLSALPAIHTPLPQNRRQVVAQTYHTLAAAGDHEGLVTLWKQNRGLVLQTIDADLEGSLTLWENSPEKPPVDDIAKLHKRALFGAQAASAAFDQPIFLDYTSSFIGWDDPQKHAFRAGQKVYGRAARDLKENKLESALEAAKETVERASALGDWWGTAMGYNAQADAARQLGFFEDALLAYGMARQINHALGLESAEYRTLQGMLKACRAAERPHRALTIASALATYAKAFNDVPTLKATLATKIQLQEKLHLDPAKTVEALDSLGA